MHSAVTSLRVGLTRGSILLATVLKRRQKEHGSTSTRGNPIGDISNSATQALVLERTEVDFTWFKENLRGIQMRARTHYYGSFNVSRR
jgi:hypothetical protein